MTRYFHVTTSATLIGLTRSHFNLCSSAQLIAKYHFAPIAGEITGGGNLGATIDPGIAFAKEGDVHWDLSTLLRGYGKAKTIKTYFNFYDIQKAVNAIVQGNFSHISELIIQLMREKQMGYRITIPGILAEDFSKQLQNKLEQVIRLYLLNYVFSTYFIHKPGSLTVEACAIRNYFIQFIAPHLPLNFLELSEKQRSEFLDSFHFLFNKAMQQKDPFQHTLHFSDYFQRLAPKENAPVYFAEYEFDTVLLLPDRMDFIDFYLHRDESSLQCSQVDHKQLAKKICQVRESLSKKIALLQAVLQGQVATELLDYEKIWCKESYSMVFVLESEALLTPVKNEYRVFSELQLGTDIKTIAVAEENIARLQAFFMMHGIPNMNIISINQLQNTHSSMHEESFFKTRKEPLEYIAKMANDKHN